MDKLDLQEAHQLRYYDRGQAGISGHLTIGDTTNWGEVAC